MWKETSRQDTGELINIPREVTDRLTVHAEQARPQCTEQRLQTPTAEPAGGKPEGRRSPDRGGQNTVCLSKSRRS